MGEFEDEIARLRPPNPDAEHLSWTQRIVAMEGILAVIGPVVLGEERRDGTTRPGVLRRLETLENAIQDLVKTTSGLNLTTKVGGAGAFAAWLLTQSGVIEPLRKVVITWLGGHL